MRSLNSALCGVVLLLAILASSIHAQSWQELLAKADSLTKVAQYDTALVLAKQALAITEREYGKEDTCVAKVLNVIGDVYYRHGMLNEVEPFWKRTLNICEKILGPDHLKVAASLINLGVLYVDQGRYAEAEPLYLRALQIREKALGAEHPDVAASLSNLALLYVDQGRYADAEPLSLRALQIMEKALGAEHLYVAKCLNNLANLYVKQGRYADAEPLYLRVLQIREKALGEEHPVVAMTLNNLALLYGNQGRYAEAEPLSLRALQIREKALGANHPDVASSLNVLADLYFNQVRFADAEPLYLRALQIREKALGANHPYVATTLNNLANLYDNQGRYAEAEPLFRRALQIMEKALGAEHPHVAGSLINLASLYRDQGRYADAEPLFLRALQIMEKALGAEHPDVAASLYNLAELYDCQGHYKDAEPFYHRALAISEKALGPEHPDVARSLYGIAFDAQQRGQFAAAETVESRAWNIRRKSFHDGAAVLAERSALEYSQFLEQESAHYLSILLDAPGGQTKNVKELADVIVSSKSQISDGILTRNCLLVSESDSTTIRLSDALRSARFTLSKLFTDGPGEDSVEVYRRKLDNATKEKERLEADLARRSTSFRKDQELWDAKSDEVMAALPQGAALVEFVRYDHRISSKEHEPRYLVMVISSGGARSVFPLGAAAATDTAVTTFRDYFQHPDMMDAAGYTQAVQDVYKLVWQPFASLLEGANTVFIAPDGDLNMVSFAGLMDENGKFLIEKYPIHYLSTGRDLIRLKDKPPSGTGLLAMGDPDYDLSFQNGSVVSSTIANINLPSLMSFRNLRSGCQALKDLKVSRLPGTRTEVDAVSGRWKSVGSESVLSYLGNEATEENLKQNAPGKRVIHLATHGYYISEECQPKQAVRDLSGQSAGDVGENPLLLSGFLLAGANHHEDADEAKREDGIVTAEDVAGLNLQGTDLVVLSSCESGLGTVKSGEGVYGLRRAFQMAGARTVISALWPIDDKATAEFMGQLFSAKDETLPQTMQRISLSRLASLRAQGKSDHPFYWAAFVATGDWKTH